MTADRINRFLLVALQSHHDGEVINAMNMLRRELQKGKIILSDCSLAVGQVPVRSTEHLERQLNRMQADLNQRAAIIDRLEASLREAHATAAVLTGRLHDEHVRFVRLNAEHQETVRQLRYATDRLAATQRAFQPEPQAKPAAASSSTVGFRWATRDASGRELFLPHGTRLRMRYHDQIYFATVDGTKIVANGEILYSTFAFMQKVTGKQKAGNPLVHIEIMRPGDTMWYRARTLFQSL